MREWRHFCFKDRKRDCHVTDANAKERTYAGKKAEPNIFELESYHEPSLVLVGVSNQARIKIYYTCPGQCRHLSLAELSERLAG